MKWALRIGFLGIVVVTLLIGAFAVTWRPETTDSPDEQPSGPLVQAANNGNAETVRRLLEKGADPDSADANGHTALWWAVRQGEEEVVAVLVAGGADPDWSERGGETPRALAEDLARTDPSALRQQIVETLGP